MKGIRMEYSFIGIDEGRQQIFRGETSGRLLWKTDLEDYPLARSMQRLDGNRILAGYDRGYFIIDLETGKIIHQCDRWKKVTSAERTPDGRTLVTGQDIGGSHGIWVLTLDDEDKQVESARRRGSYIRVMRSTGSGSGNRTYLLSMNTRIFETDTRLRKIRKFKADGFKHAWMARRLDSGETLVSAGYGAFMALFGSRGNLIGTYGGKDDVPQEVNPFFYASFDIAPDGNLLVANWQGHGPDRGDSGRQLLCFSPDGEYLAGWSFEGISSFQGLLLV